MMTPHVLLPLRSSPAGLTRLAGTLSAPDRNRLAAAMLADVVATLRAAGLHDLTALTAGGAAAESARELGLEVRPDAGARGLDAAVADAVAGIGGDEPVAVVMPDLPCLTICDVSALLRAAEPVVVAPTGDGGTGALLRRPARVIPTAYGPDSATRHVRLAHRAGVGAALVRAPGLSRDVDTVDDLESLRGDAVGPATGAFLASSAPLTPSQRPRD